MGYHQGCGVMKPMLIISMAQHERGFLEREISAIYPMGSLQLYKESIDTCFPTTSQDETTRSGLGNVIHVDPAFPPDGDPAIRRVQYLFTTKQGIRQGADSGNHRTRNVIS
jgi:hypothetical protein